MLRDWFASLFFFSPVSFCNLFVFVLICRQLPALYVRKSTCLIHSSARATTQGAAEGKRPGRSFLFLRHFDMDGMLGLPLTCMSPSLMQRYIFDTAFRMDPY